VPAALNAVNAAAVVRNAPGFALLTTCVPPVVADVLKYPPKVRPAQVGLAVMVAMGTVQLLFENQPEPGCSHTVVGVPPDPLFAAIVIARQFATQELPSVVAFGSGRNPVAQVAILHTGDTVLSLVHTWFAHVAALVLLQLALQLVRPVLVVVPLAPVAPTGWHTVHLSFAWGVPLNEPIGHSGHVFPDLKRPALQLPTVHALQLTLEHVAPFAEVQLQFPDMVFAPLMSAAMQGRIQWRTE
jgi:hypothetical protein